MRQAFKIGLFIVGVGWGLGGWVWAELTPEELAKESEAYCTETAVTAPTTAMVMEKVNKACELINQEGKAGFAKLQGKGSEFIFAGTYIWVNDMDGVMLMHPIKYKMNGNDILDIKDANGKRLFAEFIDVCKTKGSGWVDYLWPKPGEKMPSQKISFVKKAMCDGKEVVVGCGIYDVPAEEMQKLVGQ